MFGIVTLPNENYLMRLRTISFQPQIRIPKRVIEMWSHKKCQRIDKLCWRFQPSTSFELNPDWSLKLTKQSHLWICQFLIHGLELKNFVSKRDDYNYLLHY